MCVPIGRLEGRSRASSDGEDRRTVGGSSGASDERRVAHEHQRAGGGVNILPTHGEDGVSAHHRKEFLMAVRELGFVVALVVRLHHLIARAARDPVHPERSNVEVTAHEMEVAGAHALPIRAVRIVGVDVRRQSDIGKVHGAERRFAWISHEITVAGHRPEVNREAPSMTSGDGWRRHPCSRWFDAAKDQLAGDHPTAADRYAAIGLRPDEASERLRGAEAAEAAGRADEANEQRTRPWHSFASPAELCRTAEPIANRSRDTVPRWPPF